MHVILIYNVIINAKQEEQKNFLYPIKEQNVGQGIIYGKFFVLYRGVARKVCSSKL
jgi:hypothetical protein